MWCTVYTLHLQSVGQTSVCHFMAPKEVVMKLEPFTSSVLTRHVTSICDSASLVQCFTLIYHSLYCETCVIKYKQCTAQPCQQFRRNFQRCSLCGHRAGRCFAFGVPNTCWSTESREIGEGEKDRKEKRKRTGKLYSRRVTSFPEFGSKNFLINVIIMNFHNPLPRALSSSGAPEKECASRFTHSVEESCPLHAHLSQEQWLSLHRS